MSKLSYSTNNVFLSVVLAIIIVAFVLVVQVALWAVVPLLVYWVAGWFIDDQTWRLAFACVAFAGIMLRGKGGLFKYFEDKCKSTVCKTKSKTKYEDIDG